MLLTIICSDAIRETIQGIMVYSFPIIHGFFLNQFCLGVTHLCSTEEFSLLFVKSVVVFDVKVAQVSLSGFKELSLRFFA